MTQPLDGCRDKIVRAGIRNLVSTIVEGFAGTFE
jgi:hypothetical protein